MFPVYEEDEIDKRNYFLNPLPNKILEYKNKDKEGLIKHIHILFYDNTYELRVSMAMIARFSENKKLTELYEALVEKNFEPTPGYLILKINNKDDAASITNLFKLLYQHQQISPDLACQILQKMSIERPFELIEATEIAQLKKVIQQQQEEIERLKKQMHALEEKIPGDKEAVQPSHLFFGNSGCTPPT